MIGILSFPVFSQCTSGDCVNGYGVKKFSVGTFSGYFKNGSMANGEFKYDSGAIYKGDFLSGTKNGFGIMEYSDGSRYEGDWVNDGQQGKGIIKFSNGNTYDGEWVNSKRQGYGTFTYSNGDSYVGNWVSDKRQGYATYKYNNGDCYIGDWVNDVRQGQGKMIFSDGRIEEGTWVADRFKTPKQETLITSNDFSTNDKSSSNSNQTSNKKSKKPIDKNTGLPVGWEKMSSEEIREWVDNSEEGKILTNNILDLAFEKALQDGNSNSSSTSSSSTSSNRVFICSSNDGCCLSVVNSKNKPQSSICNKRKHLSAGQKEHIWIEVGKQGNTSYVCNNCSVVVNTSSNPQGGGCCPVGGCVGHSWSKVR